MKVEVKVDWSASAETDNRQPTAETLEPPKSRVGRRLWHLALARHIEDVVRTDEFSSYAFIARRCGVSHSRISQLLDANPPPARN